MTQDTGMVAWYLTGELQKMRGISSLPPRLSVSRPSPYHGVCSLGLLCYVVTGTEPIQHQMWFDRFIIIIIIN
jgi:hypothetical protein